MSEYERELGKIVETYLGVEDHGILTATLGIDFGGAQQGIGGYFLDAYDATRESRHGTAEGMEFVRRLLKACGVEQWEKLRGRTVYVLRKQGEGRWGAIVGIENLPTESGERFLFEEAFPRR